MTRRDGEPLVIEAVYWHLPSLQVPGDLAGEAACARVACRRRSDDRQKPGHALFTNRASWQTGRSDAKEAAEAWHTRRHAVVLLDLGLPDRSGVDLLRTIRGDKIDTPVLVITARADVESRVDILDQVGADDYIVKPFELRELFARIRAVLRRHQSHPRSVLEAGELQMDLALHVVTYRGKTLRMAAREFALLQVLLRQAGKIVSREVIEREIYLSPDEIGSNAVDVLIHGIRRKFDKEIIRNIRGAGWLIMQDAG